MASAGSDSDCLCALCGEKTIKAFLAELSLRLARFYRKARQKCKPIIEEILSQPMANVPAPAGATTLQPDSLIAMPVEGGGLCWRGQVMSVPTKKSAGDDLQAINSALWSFVRTAGIYKQSVAVSLREV
jgi:hypothetical protein